ncbi:MAG: DUF3638 domain-containing protein [Chlamydiae bacterium]|nr:DUF3638 domain-containing protein [Chlamydiota bacterium]
METEAAKQLLLGLSQIDHSAPEKLQEEQVLKNFRISVFSGKAVLSTSFWGRISYLLNGKESPPLEKKKQVAKLLQKTQKKLLSDKEALQEIPLKTSILVSEFVEKYGKLTFEFIPSEEAKKATDETSSFAKEISRELDSTTKKTEEEQASQTLSLLSPKKSDEKVEICTTSSKKMAASIDKHINETYLRDAASPTKKAYKKINSSIQKAYEREQTLYETLKPCKSPDERNQKLLEKSKLFLDEIKKLENGERWMMSESGDYKFVFFDLFRALVVINDLSNNPIDIDSLDIGALLGKLPKPISLDDLRTYEADDIAKLIVENLTEALKIQLTDLSAFLKSKSFNLLFQDERRNMKAAENSSASKKWLYKQIEDWMKMGAIGSIMEFVPDGSLRELALWLSQEGEKIVNPKYHDELSKKAGEKLDQLLNKSQDSLYFSSMKFLKKFQGSTPKFFLESIGLSSLLDQLELIMEIKNEDKDHYKITIHSNYQNLSRTYSVKKENLTLEFFHRLLFSLYEAKFNPNISRSSISDLFELLDKTFKSTPSPLFLEKKTKKDQKKDSFIKVSPIFSSISQFKMEPIEMTPEKMALFYYGNQIIDFCSPYKTKEGKLQFENVDFSSLELILEEWTGLVEKYKEDPDVKTHYEKMKATEIEIRKAVEKAKERKEENVKFTSLPSIGIELPFNLAETLKEKFLQSGFSIDHLESIRDLLVWSLGEEVGNLVDLVVEEVNLAKAEQKQPISATSPKPKLVENPSKRGTLGTIWVSIYFNMLVTFLRWAFWLSNLYAWGSVLWAAEGPIGLVNAAIINEARSKAWSLLFKVLHRAFPIIVSALINLILRCLFDKETAQKIRFYAQNVQASAEGIANLMEEKEHVSFEIDPAQVLRPVGIPDITPSSETGAIDRKTILSKSDVFFIGLSNKPALLTKAPEFTSENFYPTIRSWIESVNKMEEELKDSPIKDFAIFQFLTNRLSFLPIPIGQQTPLFDQIDERQIESCLNDLLDLSLLLTKSASRDRFLDATLKESAKVHLYAILAIVDHLSKRKEKELQKYKIDAYPFLAWLQNDFKHAKAGLTPQILEQIDQINEYFFAKIDLRSFHSKLEIIKKSKDHLFSYSFWEGRWRNKIYGEIPKESENHEITFDNQWDYKIPEIAYYANQLTKDEVKKKIQEKFPDLDSGSKHTYLFTESFNKDSDILPKPFAILKLQTMICSQMVNGGIDFTEINLTPKVEKTSFQTNEEPFLITKYLQKKKRDLLGTWSAPLPEQFIHAFCGPSYEAKPPRQADILDKRVISSEDKPNFSLLRESRINELKQMQTSKKGDHFLRQLGLLQTNKISFYDIPHFLSYTQGILLKDQLKYSPDIVKTTAHLMKRKMEEARQQEDFARFARLFSLALSIRDFCAHEYAEQTKQEFRFLMKAKEKVKKELLSLEEKATLSQLHALAVKYENPKDLVREIFHALLDYSRIKEFTESRRIHGEFIKLIWTAQPEIEKCLSDSAFQKEIFQLLFQIQPQDTGQLKQKDKNNIWKWSYKNFEIDLLQVTTVDLNAGDKIKRETIFEKLKEIASRHIPEETTWDIAVNKKINSGSGKYEIHYQETDSGITYTLKQKRDGKIYQLAHTQTISKANPYLYEILQGKKIEWLWIEENSSTSEIEAFWGEDRYFLTKEAAGFSFVVKDKKLTLGDSVKKQLTAIERFSPLSETIVYVSKNGTKSFISHLIFKKFSDLTFKVTENEKGELNAFCSQFPGYFIAKSQHISADGISSYLLLENERGQRKLLVPAGQWVSAAAWNFINPLGRLIPIINSFLSSMKQNRFFAYQMREDGFLTSDEPEALAYLLELSLLQNKNREVVEYAEKIEKIAKIKPLNGSLNLLLTLVSVAPYLSQNQPILDSIRPRLIAAEEENRTIFHQKLTNPIYFDFFICLQIYKDLEKAILETDPRKRLSDDQRWFLYKAFFQRVNLFRLLSSHKVKLDKALRQDTLLYETVEQIQETITSLAEDSDKAQTLMEQLIQDHLLLPPDMYLDYVSLKKKLDVSYSTIHRASDVVAEALKDTIKNYHSIPIPSIGTILGNDTPVTDQILRHLKDWIRRSTKQKMIFQTLLSEISWEQKADQKSLPLDYETFSHTELKTRFLEYLRVAARKEGTPPDQFNQLKLLLGQLKGRWGDEITETLIEHLTAVVEDTDKQKSIRSDLAKLLSAKEKEQFIKNLLSSVHLDYLKKIGIDLAKRIGLAAADNRIKALLNSLNPYSYLVTGANIGQLVYGMVSNAIKQPNETVEQKSEETNDSPLKLDVDQAHARSGTGPMIEKKDSILLLDESHLAVFGTFFHQIFRKIDKEPSSSQKTIHFKEVGEEENYLRTLNDSLKDHYLKTASEKETIFKLKNPESLHQSYFALAKYRDHTKQEIQKDEKLILETLNKITKNPVTLRELKDSFLTGNFTRLFQSLALNSALAHRLDPIIWRLVLKKTHLQQTQQAIQCIKELSSIEKEKDPVSYERKMEELAQKLETKRSYDLHSPLARHLLIFEEKFQVTLWPDQVKAIEALLLNEQGELDLQGNAVMELLMSFGKTFFIMPTLDALAAKDGLVINIWPSSLVNTNTQQVANNPYNQTANALTFDRNTSLDPNHLDAILIIFKRAIEKKETINMRKEDLQALELLLLDLIYRLTYPNTKENSPSMDSIKTVFSLLDMIRQATIIGDEPQLLFKDDEELNYPIGKPSTIPEHLFHVIKKCMLSLVNDENLLEQIRKNQSIPFTEALAKKIAEKLSGDYLVPKEQFVNFVLGNQTASPEMKRDQKYAEMVMVKGMLTHLLKNALGQSINVQFGSSKKDPKVRFAIPYEGNDAPIEKSTFRNPYETLVKTFLSIFCNGLTEKQAQESLDYLRKKAVKDAISQSISISETEAGKIFSKIYPNVDLESCKNSILNSTFSKDPHVISFYIEHFVLKEVKFWKKNLSSNAQNFGSMAKKGYYGTGTPHNFETYPSQLEMYWTAGTTGKAIDIINQKCTGIEPLEKETPREVLNEMLNQFFKGDKNNTSALIDAAALLKGMSNLEVAQAMREFAKKYRPDIKGIKFFMKDFKTGKEEIMWLSTGDAAEVTPYSPSFTENDGAWTYFDQFHKEGADIRQPAGKKAICTTDEKIPLHDLLQAAFRMRKIKDKRRFIDKILEKEEIDHAQTVHFVLSPNLGKILTANGQVPTLKELFYFSAKVENKMHLLENQNSYVKKVRNVIRRKVLNKLSDLHKNPSWTTFSSLSSQIKNFFKAFEPILTSSMEWDDILALYEGLDRQITKDAFLDKAKNSPLFELIENSSWFKSDEIDEIKKEIAQIPIPTLAEKMTVKEGQIKEDDLNKQMFNHLETEVEEEMEVDLNIQQQSQLNPDQVDKSKIYKEIPWKAEFNPFDLDWLEYAEAKLSDSFVSSMLSYNRRYEMPPFYKIRQLAQESPEKGIKDISGYFDERLWASNNFIPRVRVKIPVDLSTERQRPLFHTLVHLEETEAGLKVVSMGCLSQKEALHWKKILEKNEKEKQGPYKTILYDMQNRLIIRGSHVGLDRLLENEDFLKLEVELKLLNGDAYFEKDQIIALQKWFSSTGIKKDKILKAIETIRDLRGTDKLQESPLYRLWKDLQEKSDTTRLADLKDLFGSFIDS